MQLRDHTSHHTPIWDASVRRLGDCIRELSASVVAASEDELSPAISELKAALREHNDRRAPDRLRQFAARKLAGGWYSPEDASF
jgi:hypothetical protein